jgi:hypothetical protein
MRQKPVYVVLRGGLGNQLFMFASAYCLAQRSQRELQVITSWFRTKQREKKYSLHTRKFELKDLDSIQLYRKIPTKFLDYFIYGIYLISLKYRVIRRMGIVFDVDQSKQQKIPLRTLVIDGYMQDPGYFNQSREKIIQLLQLDKATENELKETIWDNNPNRYRNVALHVRRGDYLLSEKSKNLLSLEYFANCLAKFDLSRSNVFVFSDDIDWCKSNFIGEFFRFVEEKDPLKSLKLMAYCDDFIVSPSTFSWWGAWLSENEDKLVIYPNPYNEDSEDIWKELPQQNWIPESAIFQ